MNTKWKWYTGTVIFILSLLSVVNQQQSTVPNQEIVLQFTNTNITADAANHTIAIVKEQLQELGVTNIQISKGGTGTLKITYYSSTDVASIKHTLSKGKLLTLDHSSTSQNEELPELPSQEDTIAYNLDIYEIQNGGNTDWSFEGTRVLDFEPKSDRFLDPNVSSLNEIILNEQDGLIKVAYKVYEYIAISIGDSLHYIPEVRAGPIC